jgi:hypothetical protein
MSMKNSSETIGNRTRNLRLRKVRGGAVPRPTAPPRISLNRMTFFNSTPETFATIIFTFILYILKIIKKFFLPTDAQLDSLKNKFKFELKLTLTL